MEKVTIGRADIGRISVAAADLVGSAPRRRVPKAPEPPSLKPNPRPGAIFARIEDGEVRELFTNATPHAMEHLFHASLVWVDVTDIKPQPQQGWHYTAPATFAPAPAPEPTPEQQAATLMAAGCRIEVPTAPALNGTYDIASLRWAEMRDEAQHIATFGGSFSAGRATLDYVLPNGATVTFATPAQFLVVVKALADYAAHIKLASTTPNPAWPAQPVVAYEALN